MITLSMSAILAAVSVVALPVIAVAGIAMLLSCKIRGGAEGQACTIC